MTITQVEIENRAANDWIVWLNGGTHLKCFATEAAARRYATRCRRQMFRIVGAA